MNPTVYLASVCLEKNRWGSRQPSFAVSDWVDRFMADGFDGVELWEYHFDRADDNERVKLMQDCDEVVLYNTYTGFTSNAEHAENRTRAIDAVEKLTARGIKYNVGRDPEDIIEYREMVTGWAYRMPESCRLLCECHPGTVIETPEAAAEFFEDLDPQRFGVMAHLSGDNDTLEKWVTTVGPRLQHLHLQHREEDPSSPAGQQQMNQAVAMLKQHGFSGTASIEFTRGMGKDEDIETVYQNALADLSAYRAAWQQA